MELEQINLCTEVTNEMVRLNFKEENINKIKNEQQYIDAFNQQNAIQRTLLTMVLYNVLIRSPFKVPSNIRLALNIATDINGWIDDIKLVILPFIKQNEETFFG